MFSRHLKSEPARRLLALEALDERAVPAIIAQNDTYTAAAGRVLTVGSTTGVLANDTSTDPNAAVLSAIQTGAVRAVGSTVTLPSNTLILGANGSFTLVVPSNLPSNVRQLQFDYRANNLINPTEPSGSATVTINIVGNLQRFIAVGASAGGSPTVNVYDVGTGNLRYTFDAYEPGFTGGVRVAVGDVNEDGVDDIVTAPGVGGGDRIKVYDGATLAVIFDGNLLGDPNFRGGAYVAVGDVDGSGDNEIIVGAGEQGGPRVVVADVAAFGPAAGVPIQILADFFAYETTFRDGVRVAAGDTNGDGREEIITSPGAGGGPVIKVFDFQAIIDAAGAGSVTPIPTLSFLAGLGSDRNGAYVSAGDLGGTGRADIVVGTGAGQATVLEFDGETGGLIRQFNVPSEEVPTGGGTVTGPNAQNLSLQSLTPSGTLLAPTQTPLSLTTGQTLIYGSGLIPGVLRGGVPVAVTDWNGDGLADVITGVGAGNIPRVRVYNTLNNTELDSFLAFNSGFLGGINVG